MLIDVKSGVPCKLQRVDGEPGYQWNGYEVTYPSGIKVPQSVLLRSDWKVLPPEPKFEVGDKVTVKWEGNEKILGEFHITENDVARISYPLTVDEVGEWSGRPGVPAIGPISGNWCWVPEAACELYKEPTVEEYVKSRGNAPAFEGTRIEKSSVRSFPCVDSGQTPFTLETAKLACDLLEKLK